MDAKRYHKLIKKLQEEEWPGKFDSNLEWAHELGQRENGTFAPSHHFNPHRPLMTQEIVHDLAQTQKRLLSIGCGPAYLERLICRRLGVNTDQISLADISDEGVPEGFRFYQFDMYKEWPLIEGPFNYILFPECALIGVPYTPDFDEQQSRNQNALYNIISRSLNLLDPSGQVRLTGGGVGLCRGTVLERIQSDFSGISFGHTGEEFLYVAKP